MTDFDFAGLDFCIGVVRGARSFRLDDSGMLTGIVYRQVWTPGENIATCRKLETFLPESRLQFERNNPQDTRYQTAPCHSMISCRHGFYAYYVESSDFPTTNGIRAMIEGYGEVVIGTRGFRAMKARIVALQTTESASLEAISQNYAEIPLFTTFEQMTAEFPPDISERSTK